MPWLVGMIQQSVAWGCRSLSCTLSIHLDTRGLLATSFSLHLISFPSRPRNLCSGAAADTVCYGPARGEVGGPIVWVRQRAVVGQGLPTTPSSVSASHPVPSALSVGLRHGGIWVTILRPHERA